MSGQMFKSVFKGLARPSPNLKHFFKSLGVCLRLRGMGRDARDQDAISNPNRPRPSSPHEWWEINGKWWEMNGKWWEMNGKSHRETV